MRCWACADGDCEDCVSTTCACECNEDPWEDPEWDSNPYLWLDPPPRPVETIEPSGAYL